MDTTRHENEWLLLQNQFDSYEKFSLMIKLFSVGLLAAAYLTEHLSLFVLCLLMLLWLQDAIWKTFQSRIEKRLLALEGTITTSSPDAKNTVDAYQFNSEFADNRPGIIGLITEYGRHALRPTIAFPHAALVIMLGYFLLAQCVF